MLERPYISIIIPVYNCAKFLRSCLESIKCQTVNFEVILIDDGSTDSSIFICDEYSQKDNRFVCVHTKNHGPAYARNVGLSKAKGEWVTFIDSDDYIEQGYLEIPLHYPDSDLIFASFRDVYSDGSSKANQWGDTSEYFSDAADIQMLKLQCFDIYSRKPYRKLGYTCGKFLKNNILIKNNIIFPDGLYYYEDATFAYRYFNYINNIAFVGPEEPRYCYRENETSISNNFNIKLFERKIESLTFVHSTIYNQKEASSFFRFYLDQLSFLSKAIYGLQICVLSKWNMIEALYKLSPIIKMINSQERHNIMQEIFPSWVHPSQRKSYMLIKSRLIFLLALKK